MISLILATTRLWDNRKDVHSIPALARLLRDARLVIKLVEREREATHDIRKVETFAGEGTNDKVPFPDERSTPDLREHDLRMRLASWLERVEGAKGSEEVCRIQNLRHEALAHSASWLDRRPKPFPWYGDEQKALEITIPIVSEGFRLATGIDFDFSTAASVWSRAQRDFWEIARSGARGERYSPPMFTPEDVFRDAMEKGATSWTIRG